MRKIIALYFILFLLAFVYTAQHALVGLDEVMLLDPCLNFMQGSYSSKLWYAQGAENHFMAYLPALSALRIPFLYLLPNTLFFHRLPLVLLGIICAWLVYKITVAKFKQSALTFLTILLFINDKGIWDATLSGRSEMIQVFLILLFFFFSTKNATVFYNILKGLTVGALFLTHPPAWSIAVLLSIILYRTNTIRGFYIALLAMVSPLLIFLITIHFDILALAKQLFLDGSLYSSKHTFLYRISHFYERFLPYPYLYQPWVVLLILACVYFLLNTKISKQPMVQQIGWVFLLYLTFLLLVSENLYRYNPPLLVVAYLLFPYVLQSLQDRFGFTIKRPIIMAVVCLISIPYAVRAVSILKKTKNNNTAILIDQFKHSSVFKETENSLIIGEPVGYYLAMNLPSTAYSTHYTILKFDSLYYKKVYFLTYQNLPSDRFSLVIDNPEKISGGTYNALKLYEVINPSFSIMDKQRRLQ
ncbi:MAG: hypothetical protein NTW54_02530 [Bacteroidetes bacterium]|nr:hypothetical protein [Bacteroidota bacterium]